MFICSLFAELDALRWPVDPFTLLSSEGEKKLLNSYGVQFAGMALASEFWIGNNCKLHPDLLLDFDQTGSKLSF